MVRTVIFSLALIIAAAVLGFQVKQVGGGRETISVKGLAEKPIRADRRLCTALAASSHSRSTSQAGSSSRSVPVTNLYGIRARVRAPAISGTQHAEQLASHSAVVIRS